MKRHALFVGVDQYNDGHIPNLSCAVSDATDLHGFFKYGAGYDQVELLPNPSSKKEVLGKVRSLTAGLGPGDFFLFFFAGHGFRVGENHVLVCSNDLYDDVKYEDDGLPLGQLKRRLSGAFDTALLLDACQSDILATRGGEGIAERDLSLIHEAPTGGSGCGALTIVTSCDAGQTAAELSERRHGLFTVAMLDLLKEAQRAHARLDLSDAFRLSLGQRMGEIAARFGLPTEQRPRFSCTGDSCFVLLDGIVPQPSAPQSPPQHPQPAAALGLVTCPVCSSNVQPVGTHNCVKCGKKYVCADCWDKEYKCCIECARKEKERKVDNLLKEGIQFEWTDAKRAAACFREAAASGNREACRRYGDMLFNGRGVEKDVGAALTYYLKCDDSDVWIQYNLGCCHLHFVKERGDAKEGKEAVAWLQKSAKRGVPWACVKLGDCYRDGIGVPQDFADAASWYNRALEDKGLETFGDYGAAQWAEFSMGWLCRNGQGVKKDLSAALQWFRKAAAREGDAADRASTAAAEVLPDVLVERYGAKLGPYWQDFRLIHGVQIRDADDRWVPLAGLVASNRGIFVGVSLESLPSGTRNSFPSKDPTLPFLQSISDRCGIPEKCFLAMLVVPDTFPVPDAEFPFWAIRELYLVDAMLNPNSKAQEPPDWLGKRQDIIRELEKLPMSSEGAEKNALIHFEAAVPEWEDGVALLEKVGKPSPKLIQLARRAAEELEQAGKHSIADNVRKWLDKKGAAKARPAALPKTRDVKKLTLPGGAEMEMIYCFPGEFLMGSPENEEGRGDHETQHRVRLTKGFWLGKYPVTQRQWQSVMGNNPSDFKGDDLPVEKVSWDDCKDFIDKVKSSAKQQLGGEARFPTEAEWEFACRAGTTTAYSWGDALNGDMANCDGKHPCGTAEKGPYLAETTSVGRYGANPWGLYDMHGNVWEWCADWFGDYPAGSVADPKGPASGDKRVLRGGGWGNDAQYCRSACRDCDVPGCRYGGYGFRLCCSA